MDYTTWPELNQNQTQTQTPISTYPPSAPSSYTTHYISYPQNPNPSSSSSSSSSTSSSVPQSSLVTHVGTVPEPGLHPPGVDSYAPLTTNSITHLGHEALANSSYGQSHVVDPSSVVAASGYYFDPNAQFFDPNAQNWAAREAVRQYGADPVSYGAGISMSSNGSEQLAVANPNSTWWINTTTQVTQPHGNGTWKKPPKKVKTKIVQPAYCEVCKVDCTSKEVLDQHKLGKKHKKNVEKLRESLNLPQIHPSGSSNPVIGPQLQNKSVSGNKSKRKTVETPEDLEKKKKKVLEGGAAAGAVRICAICNVVCNSETVYNYHIAGQKHAAMMKKASEHTKFSAR